MRLKFYEENDDYLIDRYTITEEQLRYTMSPKASIELVNQDKDRHAVLVLDVDKLVTFLYCMKMRALSHIPLMNSRF
ncbi:hypothetical protein [Lysinibacillus xylanilyticus]|uniref:hypothetical protein n=1 Tax=Lysinibacillus xylanilyticus TaxID=582475 RepID=UPI003828118E